MSCWTLHEYTIIIFPTSLTPRRWLTLTRVLLTPHPYKGPLPKHERKGLTRGSCGGSQGFTSKSCGGQLGTKFLIKLLYLRSVSRIITDIRAAVKDSSWAMPARKSKPSQALDQIRHIFPATQVGKPGLFKTVRGESLSAWAQDWKRQRKRNQDLLTSWAGGPVRLSCSANHHGEGVCIPGYSILQLTSASPVSHDARVKNSFATRAKVATRSV